VHIVELSTAVGKVDIKAINASLTQNQSLLCNAALNATARCHWTKQWRHDHVGRRLLPNRTEFIN